MRWLVLCCALLLPKLTVAQTPEDEKLAKQYYQLGKELYGRADYAGALTQFENAYKHAKRPLMHYNIARCHEALGQHADAIAAYKRYLESKPEDAKRVEARIANLENALAQKKKNQQAQQAKLERERQARLALEQKTAQLAAEKKALQQPGRPLFWAGWSTVGAGAALLATSMIFGALAAGKASELEKANEAQEPYRSVRDDYDTGETFQTVQIATLIASGVSLVAGAALLYFHYRGAESAASQSISLSPAVGPHGASLQAQLRF